MVILGIDPGLATVGYGVVDYNKNKFACIDYGIISTPPKLEFCDRLEMIYDGLDALIHRYSPSNMAIEQIFFNTNQKTAVAVSQARGVILLCAKKNHIAFGEYTPLQVKQAVVGYGRAEKTQIMAMVKNILNLDKIPRPDDAADALAMAICHGHTYGSGLGNLMKYR